MAPGDTNRKAVPVFLYALLGWAQSLALAAMSAKTLLEEGAWSILCDQAPTRTEALSLASLSADHRSKGAQSQVFVTKGCILCPCLKINLGRQPLDCRCSS